MVSADTSKDLEFLSRSQLTRLDLAKFKKVSEEEIIEIDKQMKQEIKDGKLADPMEIQQLEMGVHPEQLPGGAMNPDPMGMGAPVEPGIDGSATEAPQMPEGGEI